MTIEQFTSQHHRWQDYLTHTKHHNMQRWIVDEQFQPLEGLHYLGYLAEKQVVGHLALKKQPIEVPQTAWSTGRDHIIRDEQGDSIEELFVQTFAVDEQYRRQGIGSQLQTAGLGLGQQLDCYQVRSWSSLDKTPNYQLKIIRLCGAPWVL